MELKTKYQYTYFIYPFAIKESNHKYSFPNGLFEFMGFNTTNGVFQEEEMRRAAACAIDRDELAQVFDSAIVSPFPVMKGSDDFTPIYETVDYSSEYAMEIIFSAGWRDNDNDGVFEKNTEVGKYRDEKTRTIIYFCIIVLNLICTNR